MKKRYQAPEVEVVLFENVDIITDSCPTNLCDGSFNAYEGDNTYTQNCNWGNNC